VASAPRAGAASPPKAAPVAAAAQAEAPKPAPPPAETPKPPAEAAAARAPAPAPAPAPLLAADAARRMDGYSAGRNLLMRERLAATREKLATESDANYSIELFLADNSDPERSERFLIRARDLVPLSEVYVVPVPGKAAPGAAARYKLRVTYGSFATKQAAAEAAKRLPPKYQKAFHFEVRSWAELRAGI